MAVEGDPGSGGRPPTPSIGFDDELLYEEAPCGYVASLPDGTIVRANRTFLNWIGYPAEEICGTRLQDHLTLAGRIYHETHFAPLLRMQGEIREIALDFVTRDGGRLPALVNTVQRSDSDGRPLVNLTTVFNAGDRRRYEQELLSARDEARRSAEALKRLNEELGQRVEAAVAERMAAEQSLRQAQKMEAIGQLTGGVAHDFNNLLTLVIGGLDMMERQFAILPDGPESQRIRRAQAAAMEGARRAAKLTQHLLAFARQQPLEPMVIDPNTLVSETSGMLRRTIGEQVELETVLAGGLWRIEVDPVQLENALLNLAVNARDAMPEGGKLTIETHNAHLDDAYVATVTETLPPGQYVMIAVTDTGTGMDQETLGRVFEPFFTTKAIGKGTGLGLSQVYGFARQSGGHIRLYSEPGHGTSVKIYLPRSEAAAAERAAVARIDPAALKGSERVLVVEDHDDLRDYVRGILGELGYQVESASTGGEALKILRDDQEFDLMLTDVVLPGGMTGRELADEAARRRPGMKVIFMTGYAGNAIVHDGRIQKGLHLISKPFTFSQLGAKVRKVLDSLEGEG